MFFICVFFFVACMGNCLVGKEDVLWSKKCVGFAGFVDGKNGVARCTHCKDFYRRGVTRRARAASRHTPHESIRNGELSTVQAVCGFVDSLGASLLI